MTRDDPSFGLTGDALRLATDRPFAWQQRLFGALVTAAYEDARDLRRQYELNLLFGPSVMIADADSGRWCTAQLDEFLRLVHNAEQVVNVALPAAIAEADADVAIADLRALTAHLARVYRDTIAWTLQVRRARGLHERMPEVLRLLASVSEPVITGLGGWMSRLHAALEAAATERVTQHAAPVDLSLAISIPDDRMQRLVAEVSAILGFGTVPAA